MANDMRTSTSTEEIVILESLSWMPTQSTRAESRASRLNKPVVIPRIDGSSPLDIPMPFVRAYSHALDEHGINKADFVQFIDNLCIAQAAPIPLQAMKGAGDILGLIPFDGSGWMGASVSAVADAGAIAIAKSRTNAYLKKWNQEYFAPRHLRVSVCKTQELVTKLHVQGHTDPTKLSSPSLETLSADDVKLGSRIMEALGPHIAPLTSDVHPPAIPSNLLNRLSGKQIQRRVREKEQSENKKAEKFLAKMEEVRARLEKKRLKLEKKELEDGRKQPGNLTDAKSSYHELGSTTSPVQSELQSYDMHSTSDEILSPVDTERTGADTDHGDQSRDKADSKLEKQQQKLERKAEKESKKMEKEAHKRAEKYSKKRSELEEDAQKKTIKIEKDVAKRLEKLNKRVEKMQFLIVENLS
ncbi:hypothetical protein B0I35DRAFT_439601 [Stachybotrys elegans]|uniref:Uncharacterized protein n=1 Tax=Stachybotrys elegans TaxID=80388 RepID=A0A8K0WME6_9HYPO|nr:hypothetical protein B0I35DRAFT_439601 [Stachybotrys elegans]